MSKVRSKKLSAALFGGALIGGALLGFGASAAQASLTLDLKFSDGSTTQSLSGTGSYTVDVWATVVGALPTAYQGIQYANFDLMTGKTGTGVVATGGLTAGTGPISPFAYHAGLVDGSQVGAAASLNPGTDSLTDRGSISTTSLDNYVTIMANPTVGSAPAQFNSLAATTWSVKVASYTFSVGSLVGSPTGSTTVQVALPSYVGNPPVASWFQDVSAAQLDGLHGGIASDVGTYAVGSGISFTYYAGPAVPTWNVNADGNWLTASNWIGPGGTVPPNSTTAVAEFTNYPTITAPRTVTVDAAGVTVNTIKLDKRLQVHHRRRNPRNAHVGRDHPDDQRRPSHSRDLRPHRRHRRSEEDRRRHPDPQRRQQLYRRHDDRRRHPLHRGRQQPRYRSRHRYARQPGDQWRDVGHHGQFHHRPRIAESPSALPARRWMWPRAQPSITAVRSLPVAR